VLASKAIAYYFRKRFNRTEKTFPEIRIAELAALPIRVINPANPADKSRHDQIVQLVEQMLTLHQRLSVAKTPQEKTALARQITATDTQLDRLVYDLYGLTPEEIKMVEGAAS
jgi:RNase P/RNase MRP subunit p29